MLVALEPERLVEPERVVAGVRDDHQVLGAVLLDRALRRLDNQSRADAATSVRHCGVDGLEAAASFGDDDAAARDHVAARWVDGDEPRASPCLEEHAKITEPGPAEGEVERLIVPVLAVRGLKLVDGFPERLVFADGRVELADDDVAVLAGVRLDLVGVAIRAMLSSTT